jgi:hypothetical protein
VRDRLDDDESEAAPVGLCDPLAAGTLERLKESLDVAERDGGAAVADRDARSSLRLCTVCCPTRAGTYRSVPDSIGDQSASAAFARSSAATHATRR